MISTKQKSKTSRPFKIPASVLTKRLDEVLATALREQRIVGAVAVVACNGDIIYRRAHGLANREAVRPMREETLFRLSSVTKPIITAAVMRLVAAGRMKFSDLITRWLPDFTPRLADGSTPALTIHQLLTHTAGLSYVFLEEPGSVYHSLRISDGLDHHADLSLQENLRRLAAAPLAYAPGTAWHYSLALDVLGAVIEREAGQALAQAIEQLVTQPLGMTNTGFVADDSKRFAVPYANALPVPVRMTENVDIPLPEGFGVSVRFAPSRVFDKHAFPSGGTGMYSNADDVLRLLEAIRGDEDFLSRDLREAMFTDHVGPQAQTSGPGWGFGYGGAVLSDQTLAASPQGVGTMQWGGLYGHTWFIDVRAGLTVLLLTNTAFEGVAGGLATEVRNAVYALV